MQYSFLLFLSVLIAGAEMCTDLNASCPNWVANGFCTSTFYTNTQKTQYCPASCGLCSDVSSTVASASSTTATGTCIDNSSSCATWNSNGFCTSTFYTDQQKMQYCAATCNLCGSATVTTTGTATTSA